MSKFILSDKSEKKFINPSKAMANADRKAVVLKGTSLLLFVAAVILSSLALPPQAKGQVPCWDRKAVGFYYRYPIPYQTPMLEPSMPYDIMLGYIYADSLLKSAGMKSVWTAAKELQDNDTMRYVQKYRYLLSDYDPMRYHTYLGTTQNFGKNSGSGVESRLIIRTRELPNGFINDVLTASRYILHVTVNSIEVDDNGEERPAYLSTRVVYTTVIDTIKGQVLPSFAGSVSSINKPIEPQTNFIFQYCNEWTRARRSNNEWIEPIKSMYDDEGNPWVMPNREYIIFANPYCLCEDVQNVQGTWQGHRYIEIFPGAGNGSSTYGMYPIKNGMVLDEGNDFGWGTSVPLTVFKQQLQQQINIIKNHGE